MKVHKLTDENLKTTVDFANACQLMLERGKFSRVDPFEQWEEMDDDDPDKIEIQKLRDYISRQEQTERIDGRLVAYEYLKSKYTHLLSLLNLTAEVLLDNCCDPMADTLEFHPSFHFNHVAPEQ